jgi:hypothetical protein
MPITKGSLKGRLQQQGSCKNSAPATAVHLQQQSYCYRPDTSNSRNDSSNSKDTSSKRIRKRPPARAELLQQQCPCNISAPATVVALQQWCSCTSGAPATAVLLQQRCSCNNGAPATAVLLQQRCPCNSGAPATAGLLLQSDTCNIGKLATAGTKVQTAKGFLARPPTRAGLLQHQGTSNCRKLVCNSRDASNHSQRQQQSDTMRNIRQIRKTAKIHSTKLNLIPFILSIS